MGGPQVVASGVKVEIWIEHEARPTIISAIATTCVVAKSKRVRITPVERARAMAIVIVCPDKVVAVHIVSCVSAIEGRIRPDLSWDKGSESFIVPGIQWDFVVILAIKFSLYSGIIVITSIVIYPC